MCVRNISAVYSQKYRDGLYLVVYFSRKIISAELNYNIYNKKVVSNNRNPKKIKSLFLGG
jgi:hypothetical protein